MNREDFCFLVYIGVVGGLLAFFVLAFFINAVSEVYL